MILRCGKSGITMISESLIVSMRILIAHWKFVTSCGKEFCIFKSALYPLQSLQIVFSAKQNCELIPLNYPHEFLLSSNI